MEIWVPGPCFPRIEIHPGNHILHCSTFFCIIFRTFFVLLQVMSAKRISSSNSVRPSIEDTSNWQKPSLICSDNDAMSKDDLIEAITLRLTRLEELELENIILKRKLNRYFLNYFLFVTAVFRKPWMCHWVQLNFSAHDRLKVKLPVFRKLESSPHSFSFSFFFFNFLYFYWERPYIVISQLFHLPLSQPRDMIQHVWPIKTNLVKKVTH